LPEDVVRHEANRVDNERQEARRHRTWLRSAAQTPARAWGGGVKLPLSLNPQETMMWRRMKTRKRGR
jgi:hypothetical protein